MIKFLKRWYRFFICRKPTEEEIFGFLLSMSVEKLDKAKKAIQSYFDGGFRSFHFRRPLRHDYQIKSALPKDINVSEEKLLENVDWSAFEVKKNG